MTRVLAWSQDRVGAGMVAAPHVELRALATEFVEIRNASPSRDAIFVTATEASTRRHGLWRIARTSGVAELLVEAEYLLQTAASPDGRTVVYLEPRRGTSNEATLQLFDAQTKESRPLLDLAVSRFSIPLWTPRGGSMFCHTAAGTVAEIDVAAGRGVELFEGEFPAPSTGGSRVAYRRGDDVHLFDGSKHEKLDFEPRSRGALRSLMSWSPDDRLLLVADSGAALGYALRHTVIDLATRRGVRLERRDVIGMQFDLEEHA